MASDCQVDFYVLDEASTAGQLACRLALMAWEKGHRIAVLTESAEAAARLDELMWNHPPGRFLPHSTGKNKTDTPVLIGIREDTLTENRDLIINLTAMPVEDPGSFARLLEIVPGSPSERNASRLKFRKYRDIGLQPCSHPIGRHTP